MAEIEIKGSKKYLGYLSKHLQEEHPKTKGKIEVERRLRRMKKGRVTMRKTGGGYDVCIAGVPKEFGKNKVEARMKANRIRKMQGKSLVSKVKKLAKSY